MDDGYVCEVDQPGPRVSYAQNGEDVRLWRAFAGLETGFYVEVGGWDPEVDSVTCSFYRRRWSGLVVEPVEKHAATFRQSRPRDRVFQVLAGSRDEVCPLHTFEGTGLSTISDDNAARHRAAGFEERIDMVQMRTITSLLDEAGEPEIIHFMVVDTEGAEDQVVDGLDLAKYRPWILVVEATVPLTQVRTTGAWEAKVTAAGYSQVAFDGLNSYFVADERAELGPLISTPPNVFDGYVRASEVRLRKELVGERDALFERLEGAYRERDALFERLNDAAVESQFREDLLTARLENSNFRRGEALRRLAEAQTAWVEAQTTSDRLSRERDQLQATISQLLGSRSWRLTSPLRRMRGGG